MKISNKLKKIANQIVEIEKGNPLDKDVQSEISKIEDIVSHLSLEEMLLIDEYIISEKLLTK